MIALYDKFDKVDASINRWLVHYSVTLLRISLGLVFFGFGVLKFFPNVCPAQSIATQTLGVMSFGLLPQTASMVFIAALECAIGLCFITGKFLRIAVWLLLFKLIGILSPLVLLPRELFTGPFHAPNVLGQYVLKDMILAAAGMVIATTLRQTPLRTKQEGEEDMFSTMAGKQQMKTRPALQPVLVPVMLKDHVIRADDADSTMKFEARKRVGVR